MTDYTDLVARLRSDFCSCVNEPEYKPIQCYVCEAADAITLLSIWKEQATAIELEWNEQAIGKLLNIPLGVSIRAHIQPAIEAQEKEIERLKIQQIADDEADKKTTSALLLMLKKAEAAEAEVLKWQNAAASHEHEKKATEAEVTRLRAGGCARDQTTTQWCAEAVALQAEVDSVTGQKLNFPVHKCGMYIEHNTYRDYYEKIEEFVEEINDNDWATPASRAQCLATDEFWSLQWYPDTPVGFYKIVGSTLEEVLEKAAEISKALEKNNDRT